MSSEVPPIRRDPGSSVDVQILATEHWSLLATRALTYNELLSRVTIFLAILSGALIALALVAQADHFGRTFIAIAIPMLLVVMYTGLTTISRLMVLNREDYRWVVGMNRLRHAYLELRPELERYFITSPHDDLAGALQTLGVDHSSATTRLGSVLLHVPQTLPGMLTVIVAAIAGAVGALVGVAVGIPPVAIGGVAVVTFVVAMVLMSLWGRRSIRNVPPSLEPRFPS